MKTHRITARYIIHICKIQEMAYKTGRDSDRPAHHDEEWPPLAATGESPRTETKTQHSQK